MTVFYFLVCFLSVLWLWRSLISAPCEGKRESWLCCGVTMVTHGRSTSLMPDQRTSLSCSVGWTKVKEGTVSTAQYLPMITERQLYSHSLGESMKKINHMRKSILFNPRQYVSWWPRKPHFHYKRVFSVNLFGVFALKQNLPKKCWSHFSVVTRAFLQP